ncbi:MAG: hypothetical protein ACI9JL_003863 [Paracoccaceae bacterium]|jgi:hypothetical protein
MNGGIITIYLPIFEEKLTKLEAKGLGETAEATRLRRVTQWAKSGRSSSPATETRVAA